MHRIRILFRFAFPGILVLSFSGLGTPQETSRHARGRGPTPMQVLLRHAIPGTRDLQLIIELTDPPLAQVLAEPAGRAAGRSGLLRGRNRLTLDTPTALAYRNQLARGRQSTVDRLNGLSGAEIQGATDVVMNAIIARIPVEHYHAVRRMPGVKKVYFSRRHRMNLSAAAETQNAAGLWARVAGGRDYAGAGQKIGIIDTGIDNTHPMFADNSLPPTSYPADFPRYDPGNQSYTNHKVIVARDYIDKLSNPRQYVQDARDEVGHGSFVAGCAAGKYYSAPKGLVYGMAPGAYLGSYKIFGTPGYNDYTTDAAVIAAIDDAVDDGMDVLNLSIGALDYLPPSEDPEVDAINNAVAAGVVVCIAAGNEGPDTHTIGSPGGASDAIAVGAVWNSRIFAPQLQVGGSDVPENLQTLPYENGSGPSITSAISATAVTDMAALDGTGLACSALPGGSLSGRIALIERGTCTFLTKVNNAAAAGAKAVVVFNNIPGGDLLEMGGLSGSTTPAVMIFRADGLALQSYLAGTADATIRIGVSTSDDWATPVTPVLVSDSSRGPAADFGIKPDLVAVGWGVYSAALKSSGTMYDSTRFIVSQGTSFSTPMVTGAAAAVMALFPSLTPAGVKSVLANTAGQVTLDGVTPASVVQAGNGLLNLGNAANAGAFFSPASLNFGVQAYSGNVSITRSLDITNFSSNTDQFTLSVESIVSGATVSLSSYSTSPISPGATEAVAVTMEAVSPLSGGFQGFVKVQSSQTAATYSIPFWGALYVPDAGRILTVSQSSSGSGIYKNLADAMAAANPGNIIEIADSETYTLSSPSDSSLPALTISTNAQGVPLHGITIRAASGQTPVIDGSSADAYACIQVIGLRGVTFQRLTIRGGETGLDLLQPSLSAPLSVSIDHCNIIDQSTSTTSSGVVLESGGDLDITYSTISGSASAGVALLSGGQLTISHSTIEDNGSDGIDATDANVQLLESTIHQNYGQGVYLVNCTGTLMGNTFTQNRGSYGDGLEIDDGSLTVTDNTFDSNVGAAISLYGETGSSAGPVVTLSRNTMRNNDYGVYIEQAQNFKMDGNILADNVQGMEVSAASSALLINNIIARSTSSTYGDGLTISGNATLRIINCDFYKNERRGIASSSGASVFIVNSIIAGNTSGDLTRLSASNVQYSLIGDGTFAGTNNNITGDPLFTDPAADDFSLAAGSPAIDAGSNAVADLPFQDYFRKFRVAAGSSNPGDGTVDLGAVESSSLFPLIYPLMVNGYSATIGDDYATGIAVLNSSATSASAKFAGYAPGGTLLAGATNPAADEVLGGGAQIAILAYQLLGLTRGAGEIGGLLAGCSQNLTGFFLVFDRDFKRIADGVDVSAQTATKFLFLRHQNDAAGKALYALFNPGVNAATVNAALLDASGSTIDQLAQPVVLPPKGQSLFTFSNFSASSGAVSLSSDRPIAGLELIGNTEATSALRAFIPGTEARLFFPHVVMNGGYTSNLGVANSAAEAVHLVMTAFDNDGTILGSTAKRTIGAGGHWFESASSLFGIPAGDMITGYVIVSGDRPGITGFCAFQYDDGRVRASAAVPGESIPRKKLLFSHIAHQMPSAEGGNYLTGIALLNPFGTRISYTMKVFDNSGILVAEMTDDLAPHAKVAKLLSYPVAGPGFFTQPMAMDRGHIEVTTAYQLLGFELFFTERVTQIAAVMAQYPE